MKSKHKTIDGASMSNRQAHKTHHQSMKRRQFIGTMGMTSTFSVLMGGFSLRAWSSPALMNALNNPDDDRILVLIQMGGGNDGLNTLVPLYDYDYYRNLRPQIGLSENQLINLTDDLAIPANCSGWDNMWKEGAMKIIQAVGYQDQNLSHFRSSDIWSSASDSSQDLASGWMGRYLADVYPDFETSPPEIPPAVQIGGIGSLVFNDGMFNMAVNVTNPEELSEIAQNGELYNTKSVPETCYGDELRFLRTVTNSTFIYSKAIQNAYQASTNEVDFQNVASDLANQLAVVSRLIKGGLGTRLYMVSINGFDTHANQNNAHPYLLQDIANSVESFFQDLEVGGQSEKVLAMTFSEFGRRIEENASGGTDHGAAAPLFLFGKGLMDNGVVGENPSLKDLDQYGNLKYQTDFRSIYATVLEHWLCVNGNTVDQLLGRHFPRIENLVLQCGAITSADPDVEILSQITHRALYSPDGAVSIKYALQEQAVVQLMVYDMNGQAIANLQEGIRQRGEHRVFLHAYQHKLSPGSYVYRLAVGTRQFSNKFVIQ